MSGGGSKTPSSTSTETKLPLWLEDASQDYIHKAEDIAGSDYQQYGGEQIAGFNPDQTNAFQAVRQNFGRTSGVLEDYARTAAQAANYNPLQVSGGSLPTTNLDAYMNPYIQQVEQGALQALDQQRLQGQNTIADQSVASGAFGGSRQGIQAGVLDAGAATAAGNLSGQLRSAGFTQAQNMAQQDLARSLQAQGMNQQAGLQAENLGLGGLTLAGQMMQGSQQGWYQDVGALEGVGGQLQGMEQQRLDLAHQQWLDQQNHPLWSLQVMQNALGSTPYGGNTISTGPAPSKGSPWAGAAGGALSGAATGSVAGPYGAAAGAVIGAGLGYAGSR